MILVEGRKIRVEERKAEIDIWEGEEAIRERNSLVNLLTELFRKPSD